MEWHSSAESLPELGDEVLVFRHDDEGDVYAIAHVDESQDGEPYWDSNDDIVHGMPMPYVSHWCPLTPPVL